MLWWLTLALWVLIIYSFFTPAVVREPKPPLETGINGGWMLIVTATQSISTLGSYVVEALPARELMLFICLGFFMLGGMLYIVLTGLIVYRALFFRMEPDQLNPPYWINMGAVAITTLAGSRLILLGEPGPLAASLHQFLPAFVMSFWATATWWIPLLVLVGLWKIIVWRSAPRYGVGLWSMVFPLGTYAAATWTYATALQLDFLTWIPGWFIIIALRRGWSPPSAWARGPPGGAARRSPRRGARACRHSPSRCRAAETPPPSPARRAARRDLRSCTRPGRRSNLPRRA